MSQLDSNILCPSCHDPLKPTVLSCHRCDIRVEGPFAFNEFATLSPEDLHFLRIFIRCEGRVREMEPALGLSYPTIRTRLTALKNKLIGDDGAVPTPPEKKEKKIETLTTDEVLSRLESGEFTFEQAMKLIKKGSKK